MIIKTGSEQKPPADFFYGDSYERGTDPWHVDAAPDDFKYATFWATGKRTSGWYLLDAWGNQIGWCPDGTEFKQSAYEKTKAKDNNVCK